MLNQARHPRTRWTWLIVPAGVVLPLIAIAVEATTHICARFVDPIPTFWHVVLVVFVPLAHLQVWRAIRRQQLARSPFLAAANGIAIGISLFYTFVFIWLLPLAVIAVLFFGIGFLPLAPLLSLIAGLVLRKHLIRAIVPGPTKSFWLTARGLILCTSIAFGFVALAELPAFLTRVGLRMAISESPEKRARGIRLLRATGNRDALLRACYPETRRTIDLLGYVFSMPSEVTPEEAQAIYYRVTGQPYDLTLAPSRLSGGSSDLSDIDPDQQNDNLAGDKNGLSLGNSHMDGSVDAEAGVAYLEWTLVFKNQSSGNREARTQIQLPPGSVVSRVSLLREGGWREAKFAEINSARSNESGWYYNPVLVTTAGPDRILLSCFHVPSYGITRVRLGITVPLLLENLGYERLLLPHFVDRNFGVANNLKHSVWIESNSQLQSRSEHLVSEVPLTSLYALRGGIVDRELSNPDSSIRFARSGIREVWTQDSNKGEESIIRQTVRERVNASPSRLVLVVDTSRKMREFAAQISAALQSLPAYLEVHLLLAGGTGKYDEGGNLASNDAELIGIRTTKFGGNLVSNDTELIGAWIRTTKFEGGADNVPALLRAWDIAEDWQDTAIVWIHNPQPIELTRIETLTQRLRRSSGPRLYSIQTNVGPDRVEDALDGVSALRTVARLGSLQSDLEKLFGELTGREKAFEYVRFSESGKEPPSGVDIKQTSAHLARLWAHDQIENFANTPEQLAINGADIRKSLETTQLGVQYQLVTPLTGAVVLENNQPYPIDGVEPAPPITHDVFPESHVDGRLILVILLFLVLVIGRQCLRSRTTQFTY